MKWWIEIYTEEMRNPSVCCEGHVGETDPPEGVFQLEKKDLMIAIVHTSRIKISAKYYHLFQST